MCSHTAELPLSSPDTNSEVNQEYQNNTILFNSFTILLKLNPKLDIINKNRIYTGLEIIRWTGFTNIYELTPI